MRSCACCVVAAALAAHALAEEPKRMEAVVIPLAAPSQVQNLRVVPAGVTIMSGDPDAAPPPQAVSILWNGGPGSNPGPWNLSVRAASSGFSNCPAVPLTAVTVTCNSATVSGGGGTATCAAAAGLSTHPVPVAGGLQGHGNRNYIVNLTLSFADAWRYPATVSPQCLLSLSYTVDFH
jgi:hypothetical protein